MFKVELTLRWDVLPAIIGTFARLIIFVRRRLTTAVVALCLPHHVQVNACLTFLDQLNFSLFERAIYNILTLALSFLNELYNNALYPLVPERDGTPAA